MDQEEAGLGERRNLRRHRADAAFGHHRVRRAAPYAFTEQGVAMLSSVLRSPRAVEVYIAVMRNLTVKEIPRQALSRREWGHDDCSLRVENLPQKPPEPGQMELI